MAEEFDFERELRGYAKRVFDNLGGLVVSGMIYLGHHLGLYKALDGAGPLDSAALAAKTGLHERWVREWLQGQAAAGLLDYDGAGGFSISAVSTASSRRTCRCGAKSRRPRRRSARSPRPSP